MYDTVNQDIQLLLLVVVVGGGEPMELKMVKSMKANEVQH